jgi:Alpha-L-rhamnosidase N-terminal domain./Bacterial alpha-L-rhamnosidase.
MEVPVLALERLRCGYLENPFPLADASPRFGWTIVSDSTNVVQTGYRVQLSLDPTFEEVEWDSGEVAGSESVRAPYGGPKLKARTRYYWRAKVRVRGLPEGATASWDIESPWSDPAWLETPLAEGEWKARFISAEGPGAWLDSKGLRLRKSFSLKGEIASARVYATALGLYELRINGREVGDEVLSPGWTSYGKRLLYQCYDVTDLLWKGENALGATVGPGWYKGDLAGWLGRRNVYGDRTALLAQLMVKYADGTEETIATDPSWRCSEGPVLYSEIYHGEVYDARLEDQLWDSPGYDDSRWRPAEALDASIGRLAPRDGLPVRRHETFKPVSLIVTPKGERVLDFGQNIAGRVRFSVKGESGDRVVLRHAEALDAQGNFYTANLRSAKARVLYVLKGGREERYEPHFTFMGFRYVCVDQWPGELDPAAFEAVALYSDMEASGSFESSSELLNKLHSNISWGLKGNFVDIPTDCPQRDERLGWTGDAQVFAGTAAFLMQSDPFFRKWLRDLAADQLPDGEVPHVVPNVLPPWKNPDGTMTSSGSACGWADAATIIPWAMYVRFGDRELLAEQYPSMRAWVERVRRVAREGLLWDSGFHFGDWVALDAKEGSYFGATPNDFTASAFYAKSTELLAKAAAALGKDEDAREYGALRDLIIEAFRNEYFSPSGRIGVRTQTACVLALDFGLAPPDHRAKVLETLLTLIEENGGHLVTGFLGTPYLCRSLADSGAVDAAYRLLMREDYPSWLYQVKKGATTVWEHWDGLKPDGSMWSADMNSFNHYAYGSIGEWMQSSVAGLSADEKAPGYGRIVFKPLPGGGLTRAKASLMTVRGLASIEWRIEGGSLVIETVVPHNATATLYPPASPFSPTPGPVELGSGTKKLSFPWKS